MKTSLDMALEQAKLAQQKELKRQTERNEMNDLLREMLIELQSIRSILQR